MGDSCNIEAMVIYRGGSRVIARCAHEMSGSD